MRRVVLTVFGIVCVAGTSASIAWSAAPHNAAATVSPALTRAVHVMHFYADGPSVSYSGSAASASRPPGISFRLPAGADTYAATITLSFQYRTSGAGKYLVQPELDFGSRGSVAVTPARRSLAPSSTATSSTMVYKAVLHPGTTYDLFVDADARVPDLGSASLDTSALLVTVEAWPRS